MTDPLHICSDEAIHAYIFDGVDDAALEAQVVTCDGCAGRVAEVLDSLVDVVNSMGADDADLDRLEARAMRLMAGGEAMPIKASAQNDDVVVAADSLSPAVEVIDFAARAQRVAVPANEAPDDNVRKFPVWWGAAPLLAAAAAVLLMVGQPDDVKTKDVDLRRPLSASADVLDGNLDPSQVTAELNSKLTPLVQCAKEHLGDDDETVVLRAQVQPDGRTRFASTSTSTLSACVAQVVSRASLGFPSQASTVELRLTFHAKPTK